MLKLTNGRDFISVNIRIPVNVHTNMTLKLFESSKFVVVSKILKDENIRSQQESAELSSKQESRDGRMQLVQLLCGERWRTLENVQTGSQTRPEGQEIKALAKTGAGGYFRLIDPRTVSLTGACDPDYRSNSAPYCPLC